MVTLCVADTLTPLVAEQLIVCPAVSALMVVDGHACEGGVPVLLRHLYFEEGACPMAGLSPYPNFFERASIICEATA